VKGEASNAATILDFELSSNLHKYSFSSASVGVRQGTKYLTMESLYLDALEVSPRLPAVRGKAVLLSQNLKQAVPMSLVFAVPSRRQKGKISRLEVSVPHLKDKTK
jgi:hypothetical protein